MCPKKVLYKYEPDYAVPPGHTLQETIDELGMDQKELAQRIGLTTQTVNKIIKGIDPVTRETAIKLERATGVPARMWNSMEMNYRERLAKIEDEKQLESDLEWLNDLPVNELKKRNIISNTRNKSVLLQDILSFFGVNSKRDWENLWENKLAASFRRSRATKMKTEAMATWLRLGELEAQKIDCEPYNKNLFQEVLLKARTLTVKPPKVFEPEIEELCSRAGVAVVFVKDIKGCPANGVSRWLTPKKALIQLSLRYKTDDHLWFSFFHEAGHILYNPKKNVYIDLARNEDDNEYEEKANQFASNILIPPEYKTKLMLLNRKNLIVNFANSIGISPGIVVGRLQKEKILPYSHCNDLKRKFEWSN